MQMDDTTYRPTIRRMRKAQPKQSAILMKQYGIKWTTGPDGRRALVIRSKTPAHAEAEVRAALRRES